MSNHRVPCVKTAAGAACATAAELVQRMAASNARSTPIVRVRVAQHNHPRAPCRGRRFRGMLCRLFAEDEQDPS